MFRTTYGQGRERTHQAPVENREKQNNTKANKKQIVFFAIYSPTKRCALFAHSSDGRHSPSLNFLTYVSDEYSFQKLYQVRSIMQTQEQT